MTYASGIDIGSTYTKAVILEENGTIRGRFMMPTGFQLAEAAAHAHREAAANAGLAVTRSSSPTSTSPISPRQRAARPRSSRAPGLSSTSAGKR